MTENVARIATPPAVPPTPAAPAADAKRGDGGTNLNDAGRYRLTIEPVGHHRFVYKVLDRVTGEVIRQLPREEIEKLISDPTYRGGMVVDTAV